MRSTYILWTSIIHMTALMEIFAMPHTQHIGSDALRDEHTINPEGQFASNNRLDSPTQFPEEDVEFIQKIRESPKCAEGLSYCENVDSYPAALVQRLLANTSYFFHDQSEIEPIEIETKQSDDEEVLCKILRHIIKPQMGQLASDNEWMYIVNVEDYSQHIYIEECRHTNACELEDVGDFARQLGYQSRCEQKMFHLQMIALLPNKTLVPKLFQMPGFCQCVFKRTENWTGLNTCHKT